jgi:hypothetical protein
MLRFINSKLHRKVRSRRILGYGPRICLHGKAVNLRLKTDKRSDLRIEILILDLPNADNNFNHRTAEFLTRGFELWINNLHELYYWIILRSLYNTKMHFSVARPFCNVAFVHSWPAEILRFITSSYKIKQRKISSKFSLRAHVFKNMPKVTLYYWIRFYITNILFYFIFYGTNWKFHVK